MKKVQVNSLTEEQYNKLYLSLCDKYNSVKHAVDFDIFGRLSGYIICK